MTTVTGSAEVGTVTYPVSAPITLPGASLSWILTGWNVHLLNQQDPSIAQTLNTPASFGTGSSPNSSPIMDGFATTPTLRYTSYAQFSSDIASGAITYPYKWLLYDTEDWTDTPQDEIDDPWTYSGKFASLAHAHGYNLIVTPARDLGNDPTSVRPKQSGENLDQWCIRVNLFGGIAAEGVDIVVIQSQADTTTLSAYDNLVNSALPQIQAGNPACQPFAELSTNYGTAQQMATAAQSVTVDGFYLSVTSAAIPQLATFLSLM